MWDGITIEDDVFVGPNATFTNDRFPRSKVYPEQLPREYSSKGRFDWSQCNPPSRSRDWGRRDGRRGSRGDPLSSAPCHRSRQSRADRGYVDAKKHDGALEIEPSKDANDREHHSDGGTGVEIYHFPWIKDMRGDLTVAEFEKDLPFKPRRYFIVFEVPSREVRGQHAHRRCHQFLTAVHGGLSVLIDDGMTRREIMLDNPTMGLHVPPMIWGTQWNYSPDAALLVFASEPYDPADYIRDYGEFVEALRGEGQS